MWGQTDRWWLPQPTKWERGKLISEATKYKTDENKATKHKTDENKATKHKTDESKATKHKTDVKKATKHKAYLYKYMEMIKWKSLLTILHFISSDASKQNSLNLFQHFNF